MGQSGTASPAFLLVTIPPLQEEEQYKAYNFARLAMASHLSNKDVAPRYRQAAARMPVTEVAETAAA